MLSCLAQKHLSGVRFITFDDNRWLQFNGVSAIRQNTAVLAEKIKDAAICTEESPVSKILIPQDLVLRGHGAGAAVWPA